MSVVELALFRKHVRSDDFDDDNEYLQHLLDAAEAAVITETNRTKEELIILGGGTFPTPLIHAIMVIGAHWYNQRESVSTAQMHAVPYSLQSLVKPYVKLVDDTEEE